jgi:hypothetical protein
MACRKAGTGTEKHAGTKEQIIDLSRYKQSKVGMIEGEGDRGLEV